MAAWTISPWTSPPCNWCLFDINGAVHWWARLYTVSIMLVHACCDYVHIALKWAHPLKHRSTVFCFDTVEHTKSGYMHWHGNNLVLYGLNTSMHVSNNTFHITSWWYGQLNSISRCQFVLAAWGTLHRSLTLKSQRPTMDLRTSVIWWKMPGRPCSVILFILCIYNSQHKSWPVQPQSKMPIYFMYVHQST